jgi:hypothetical protein
MKIDWNSVPEWVKYIGVNAEGQAFRFEHQPVWSIELGAWFKNPYKDGRKEFIGLGHNKSAGHLHARPGANIDELLISHARQILLKSPIIPKVKDIWSYAPIWANWVASNGATGEVWWFEEEPMLFVFQDMFNTSTGKRQKVEGVSWNASEKICRGVGKG